jgi:MFS family permease
MAPQGIGAALVMPMSGRLTDEIGGGRVVLFGMIVMTIGSVGLTFLGAGTSFLLTSAILVVRGIGLGCSMMPSMAAAYSTISREAVPRATTALNVLQRVGGSIGTALLAVVLEDQLKSAIHGGAALASGAVGPLPPAVRARVAVPLAHAFSHTFWWSVGLTALALPPAIVLARVARRGGAAGAAGTGGGAAGTGGGAARPRRPALTASASASPDAVASPSAGAAASSDAEPSRR